MSSAMLAAMALLTIRQSLKPVLPIVGIILFAGVISPVANDHSWVWAIYLPVIGLALWAAGKRQPARGRHR